MLPTDILVIGGYGTFGSIVVRELISRGVVVTIAGRNSRSAEQLARRLDERGELCRVQQMDLRDPRQLRDACSESSVVVNCAGPFSSFDASLLEICLDEGCHYVDIADDRRFVAETRGYHAGFAAQGRTAAYGCSSLPSISGALAIVAAEHAKAEHGLRLRHLRLTLFVGNKNPKGAAAVRSTAELLGTTIDAPQGLLTGLHDPELVPLPDPFGARRCVNFESPDYDLMPSQLRVDSVSVKVGFELGLTTWLFQIFSSAPKVGQWLLPRLAGIASCLPQPGCSGGVVMAELELADDSVVRAAVVARTDGQRMAALPAVYVAHQLMIEDSTLAGAPRDPDAVRSQIPRGAVTAYEALGSRPLLNQLQAEGFEVLIGF